MKIEKLDDMRLIISLTEKDMKAFKIDNQNFDWSNDSSKSVIDKLLSDAKEQTGFVVDKHRLMIEFFPNGAGCVIMFTLLSKGSKKRKIYKIKGSGEPFIYYFVTLEDLFCALNQLSKIQNYISESQIVYYDKKYFIILYTHVGLTPSSSMILSEYGILYGYGKIKAARVCEFGKTIATKDAISQISPLFS